MIQEEKNKKATYFVVGIFVIAFRFAVLLSAIWLAWLMFAVAADLFVNGIEGHDGVFNPWKMIARSHNVVAWYATIATVIGVFVFNYLRDHGVFGTKNKKPNLDLENQQDTTNLRDRYGR